MKRYAKQRERAFTDPLIREDEMARVREARERITRRTFADDREDGEKKFIERKHPR